MARLQELASTFAGAVPAIYQRRAPGQPDVAEQLGVRVHDWAELRRRRELEMLQAYGNAALQPSFVPNQGGVGGRFESGLRPVVRIARTNKTKGAATGRTYTSKFRGVHQTFPTRRWEAQFRRNGKPTSLGCFDNEEEAARGYDKMMLWCELHNAGGVKGGVTNFDPGEYEAERPWLQQVTQDELVQILRSDGRRQAAQRMTRQKQEGGPRGRGSPAAGDGGPGGVRGGEYCAASGLTSESD